MAISGSTNWRLGVDVGNRSVGLSAVQYSDDGNPVKILSAVTYIHDGGIDEEKVPDSRKAKAGVARRVRRMRKYRRGRLNALRHFLAESGFAPEVEEAPQTYDAWNARSRLSREYIADPKEREMLLSRAILHIAHFRGWRNPWKGIDSLKELPVPSQSLGEMLEFAKRKFVIDDDKAPRTIGDLGALNALSADIRVRPRVTVEGSIKKMRTEDRPLTSPLLFNQIKQEDVLAELELILEMQRIDEKLRAEIIRRVFDQKKPYVKADSVGKDPFDGSPRALRASLEFQEFRIRDKVANLRQKVDGVKMPLPLDVVNGMVDYLLNYRDEGPVYWSVLGEYFSIPEEQLSVEKSPDGSSLRAPINDTLRIIMGRSIPKVVTNWWGEASFDLRSELINYLADPVESELSPEVEDLFARMSDDDLGKLLNLKFASGRSPYGRETLRKLNAVMRDTGCDLYTARSDVFDAAPDWRPPLPSFDSQTGQPAVDRNLAIVRRFLMAATQKWGTPSRVVIEHQRDGFITPKKAREIENEQARLREENNELREELIASGIAHPRKYDIRKKRLLQLQNTTCLYCGDPITWETTELDHIVPRADGGSNRVSNLAAVCRRCNSSKGRMTFFAFATSGKVPSVSLEEAIARVRRWLKPEARFDKNRFEAYQNEVINRLRRKTFDEPIDERSFASTAYAAVEVRERIEDYLVRRCELDPKEAHKRVVVFNGRVTSLARKAAQFDRNVNLRGLGNKTRLDRRHHALDATIVTSLSAMVAQGLVVIDEKRQSLKEEGLPGWMSEEIGNLLSSELSSVYFRWLRNATDLAVLLGAYLDEDKVPVINPHRLTTRFGSLHKESIEPLTRVKLGSRLDSNQIRRVVNQSVYLALREIEALSGLDGGGVKKDSDREILLSRNSILGSNELIEIFPSRKKDGKKYEGGALKVSNGWVEMGFFHHARVFAWRDKKSNIKFGIMRIFAAEMAKIGLNSDVDLMTAPIPIWSESYRLTDPSVIHAIENLKAIQIGWIAVGDEFDFGSPDNVPGSGMIRSFLSEFPESRWSLDGIPMVSKLRLRPLFLAKEGLGENSTAESVSIIDRPGWLPAVGVAFGSPNLNILRRTALGNPRWESSHQPTSWNPFQRAEELLS
ncbi:MAG: HNH endonuclease [Actinomycetota bacterium]|nr:HNH endonuclease [Actinomycetota bacterium]